MGSERGESGEQHSTTAVEQFTDLIFIFCNCFIFFSFLGILFGIGLYEDLLLPSILLISVKPLLTEKTDSSSDSTFCITLLRISSEQIVFPCQYSPGQLLTSKHLKWKKFKLWRQVPELQVTWKAVEHGSWDHNNNKLIFHSQREINTESSPAPQLSSPSLFYTSSLFLLSADHRVNLQK